MLNFRKIRKLYIKGTLKVIFLLIHSVYMKWATFLCLTCLADFIRPLLRLLLNYKERNAFKRHFWRILFLLCERTLSSQKRLQKLHYWKMHFFAEKFLFLPCKSKNGLKKVFFSTAFVKGIKKFFLQIPLFSHGREPF